ncbi:MAG: HD-GYP domain-containing protein [Chloroflexi bacterium]|nr:HD-GYP domain-containing protein [Chloroflexota bacterium]
MALEETEEFRALSELKFAREQLLIYAADLKKSYDAERKRRQQLHRAYLDTIKVLAAAIEARDTYTGGHVERVTGYCLAMARELDWGKEKLLQVEMGAALHDIGKIGLEDAVLRKAGPLTDEEWRQVKTHPALGAQMMTDVQFLETTIPYVLYHHERYDGRGYPSGLTGEAIPVEGRLVAVADAFDAMTSLRPYRPRIEPTIALDEIKTLAGVQFDPGMVTIFVRIWNRGALGRCLKN